MPQIKPGRYTDLPKGYLTYPIKGEKNTSGLLNVLLTEKRERKLIVESGSTKIQEHKVYKPVWDALAQMGVKVYCVDKISTHGRKSLLISRNGSQTSLPVEIRKILSGKDLIDIRIRVVGKTESELLDNIKAIKLSLSVWNITPKECVWSQGAWKEEAGSNKSTNKTEIENEIARLKEIVKSQAVDIAELKEVPIKKAMKEDRDVMKGVLS